tara:strand:+ start:129 stop:476 length:348 start_codon:yes stop_codon:yes gene_type:complete
MNINYYIGNRNNFFGKVICYYRCYTTIRISWKNFIHIQVINRRNSIKIDGYLYNKDIFYNKILKQLDKKRLKLLIGYQNQPPKQLVELADMIFSIRDNSKSEKKIVNKRKKEIEK